MDSRIRAHLRPDVLQFRLVAAARQGDAASFIGRLALFQGRVVEPTAQQHDALPFRSGLELVLDGRAERSCGGSQTGLFLG
jgi:hypothetical protein